MTTRYIEKTRYPGYYVTRHGEVFSEKTGRMKPVKATLNADGYERVDSGTKEKRSPSQYTDW